MVALVVLPEEAQKVVILYFLLFLLPEEAEVVEPARIMVELVDQVGVVVNQAAPLLVMREVIVLLRVMDHQVVGLFIEQVLEEAQVKLVNQDRSGFLERVAMA